MMKINLNQKLTQALYLHLFALALGVQAGLFQAKQQIYDFFFIFALQILNKKGIFAPVSIYKLYFLNNMAVKIRLARHGKKAYAFYHIVVADSRAPRDGKFIEKLGVYDPNTDPATIELDFDSALDWLNKGAQPTETTRAILSYKGVLLRKHLDGGIKKGALTPEAAEQKFQAWIADKKLKISTKKNLLDKVKIDRSKSRLGAEIRVKEAKAEDVAKKKAALAAKAAAAAATTATEAEATPAPAPESTAAE
jgi:small subunit ribosomal protein S16